MKYKINSITGKILDVTFTFDDASTYQEKMQGAPVGDEAALEDFLNQYATAYQAGKATPIVVDPKVTAKIGVLTAFKVVEKVVEPMEELIIDVK